MVLKRLVALMWCTLPEIHSSGLEPGRALGGGLGQAKGSGKSIKAVILL